MRPRLNAGDDIDKTITVEEKNNRNRFDLVM